MTAIPKQVIRVHGTSDTVDTIAVIHEVVERLLLLLGIVPAEHCTVRTRLDGTEYGRETIHIHATNPEFKIDMAIVGEQYLDPPMVVFVLQRFSFWTPDNYERNMPNEELIAELQNIYLEARPATLPVPQIATPPAPPAVPTVADPRYVPVEFLRDVDI